MSTRDRLAFDDTRQRQLRDLFERFNDAGLRYVVPRGYDELPEAVRGGDLDVFVDADDFSRATDLSTSVGFGPKRSTTEPLRLLSDAARKPARAATMLVSEPSEVYRLVRESVVPGAATEGRRGYTEARLHDDGLQLHLFNHLAYASTLDERKIRVHPEVERQMLDHRMLDDPWPVPHRVDAFVHLVCRGVFDYGGEFPDYYLETCTRLFADVRDDPDDDERLRELLELVFFDASSLVYDLAAAERYEDMRDELRRFSEY